MPVTVATNPPMREEKPCPVCGEKILSIAIKCKHCGEMLDESVPFPVLKRPNGAKSPPAQKRFVLPKSSAPVAASLTPKPASCKGGIILALLIGGAIGYGVGSSKIPLAALVRQTVEATKAGDVGALVTGSTVDLQEVIAYPDKYEGKTIESIVSLREAGAISGDSNLLINVCPLQTTDAYFKILARGDLVEKASRICAAAGTFGRIRVKYVVKKGFYTRLIDIDLAQ
ncbi:MAG: hypothetical protein WCL29_08110 [Pseudomonadota bacterium]